MAEEQNEQALKEARDRYTRARARAVLMAKRLDEILTEYREGEQLSSVDSFKKFRDYYREALIWVRDDINLVLEGSLNRGE